MSLQPHCTMRCWGRTAAIRANNNISHLFLFMVGDHTTAPNFHGAILPKINGPASSNRRKLMP
jgi:hypothetical protein